MATEPKVCPTCGKSTNSNFCPEDGSKTVSAAYACTKCGAPSAGKFCTVCGAPTAAGWRLNQERPDAVRHIGSNSGNEWSEKLPESSHNVFGDADDPSKREEERMNRHADASLGRAVDNRAQGGPKKPFRDTWLVSLVGCPQDPGAPVSLKVDDVVYFTSPGNSSNDVTVDVEVPRNRYGNHNFNLKLPVMGPQGNINKVFDTQDGYYVRFRFSPQGLAMEQQSWPWEN